jgi:hypothetical protein
MGPDNFSPAGSKLVNEKPLVAAGAVDEPPTDKPATNSGTTAAAMT